MTSKTTCIIQRLGFTHNALETESRREEICNHGADVTNKYQVPQENVARIQELTIHLEGLSSSI